jgi:hypothetical protein
VAQHEKDTKKKNTAAQLGALLGIEPRPLALETTQSKYRTSRLQGLVKVMLRQLLCHPGNRHQIKQLEQLVAGLPKVIQWLSM